MTTYTIKVPMHAPLLVKAIGKKNGKVVLEVIEAPRSHPDVIGSYLRYTQDWIDTSPSVELGNTL